MCANFAFGALVSRTRSSHASCGKCGCELRVQRDTRIIALLVVLRFRSSHPNLPRVLANFGIGPLAAWLSIAERSYIAKPGRPRGGVVTQRTANPRTPVQFRAWPPTFAPPPLRLGEPSQG